MKNTWENKDLRILKKRYSTRGAKYVAKRTGHPISSVVIKAKALGVHAGSLRRWKQFEVNYVLNNSPQKPVDSIARTLKRSPLSVNNKARQLKIFVPKPKKWSEEELNLLKKLWIDKKYSIDEVAAKLNKPRAATHYQAWNMGLRRPEVWRFWTKEQISYLRKTYKKKTYTQIAKDLGMSRIAVFQKARRMGLKLRQTPRRWTQADDDYIRQNYRKIPTREIAQKLNRSLDAIINRAGPLGISRKKVKKHALAKAGGKNKKLL